MKLQQSSQTVVALANGAELANNIIQEVIGNDVADTLEGNALTTTAVTGLIMSHFQTKLNSHRGGV